MPRFLLDFYICFYYSVRMLNGIKIYSSDALWRHILSEMGATVFTTPDDADVNFDALGLAGPVSALAIQTAIQNALDGDIHVIHDIVGHNVHLPVIQARIMIMLHKSGGMSGAKLRAALGYSPSATTHAVDTAIYQLRRTFGRDFIINDNGVYRIGRV